MHWLLGLAEEAPRLTPEEWQALQRQMVEQQMQQMRDSLWAPLWVYFVIELLLGAFTLWMIVYCIRHDTERQTWLWILLFFPVMGAAIYFFSRWLPSTSFEMPTFLRRWTDGAKIDRLEASARQIGNPYQFIEWGDALRDVKRWDEAATAYEQALGKEPANLPALWGLATSQSQLGRTEAARGTLEAILKLDPAYKFGDVSLMYGRILQTLPNRDEATAHWRLHLKRWQQPEALYSLAEILISRGEYPEARQLLHQMFTNIEITPRAFAKKVFFWKGRGKKLLRSIPKT